MEVSILDNFLYATGTTIAFAIVLQSHKRYLWVQGIIGTIGWVIYMLLKQQLGHSSFEANMLASLVISVSCELMAVVVKQPATILVIPSIFPLVPGLGMYLGMSRIIEKNYEQGINILLTAAGDAAAIALGIMMVTSVFRFMKIMIKPKLWGRPE